MKGKNSHKTMAIIPATATKIWKIAPVIINISLKPKPINRENIFDIKTFKYSLISSTLGYLHTFLRQGENKVLKSNGKEKKFVANNI